MNRLSSIALEESGAVVNTAIMMAVAEGTVKNHDSNMLKYNGRHNNAGKKLGQEPPASVIGYVKRRSSTKAKVSVPNFQAYKARSVCL